jgi:hypothetical protein
LSKDREPEQYAVGLKELWEVSPGRIEAGTVIHSLGYPLRQEQFGGGFIYAMPERRVSLGLVVGLDYHDPLFDPHMAFNSFKQHPFVRDLLAGGTLIRYGAKALPEGGWNTIPQAYMDGALIAGDAGGFLNSMRLKGIHLAMRTGMLAAESAFESIRDGDTSAASLSRYQQKIDAGPVRAELYPVRNVHQAFGYGLFAGMAFAGLSLATGRAMVHGPGWKSRARMHEEARVVLRARRRPRVTYEQRHDDRPHADVRQAHERPLLGNRPRRGSTVTPPGSYRGLHVGCADPNTGIRAPVSVPPTSTRSFANPVSRCGCRSTPPTACIARRATSWTRTRSSPGCRRRVAAARSTTACKVSDWRSSWTKRAQAAAIAGAGYPLVNALGRTLRWRVEGLHHFDAIAASGRQPVMAFWHGRILPATVLFPRAAASW